MDDPGKNDPKSGVLLVAGFLGAGKTTFLKHLLSWKQDMSDTVVIVNEFGKLGIDASMLEGEESDVIELTSGCICCTLTVDLTVLLRDIFTRFNPRWIIIEASGVADPSGVAGVFKRPEIEEHVGFLKVVTVLAADHWELRQVMGTVFQAQLDVADTILLNKVDVVDPAFAKQALAEIRQMLPQTQILPTIKCETDLEGILAPPDETSRKTFRIDHLHHIEKNSVKGFFSFSFQEDSPLDEHAFRQMIDELPPEIFRVKGRVRFEESGYFLNYVGGRGDWNRLDSYPQTQLAFVAFNNDGREIMAGLRNCLA